MKKRFLKKNNKKVRNEILDVSRRGMIIVIEDMQAYDNEEEQIRVLNLISTKADSLKRVRASF